MVLHFVYPAYKSRRARPVAPREDEYMFTIAMKFTEEPHPMEGTPSVRLPDPDQPNWPEWS